MPQFNCVICGEHFRHKSALESHLMVSHPVREITAADVEKAINGMEFPESKTGLIEAITQNGDQDIVPVIEAIPDRIYEDGAEVARALGEVRCRSARLATHDGESVDSAHRPAIERIVSLFSGLPFPATADELRDYALLGGAAEDIAVLDRFSDGTYRDMTEVAEEVARLLPLLDVHRRR